MAPSSVARNCEHDYPTCCQISLPLKDIVSRRYDAAMQRILDFLSAEQRPTITSHFPFQRLPPEIRNAIYHLHLVRAKVTRLRKWDDSLGARAQEAVNVWERDPNHMPPLFEYTALSILAASRQLRHEALGIFYSHNTFHFTYITPLRDFLSSIGPERRGFVRNISFGYRGPGSPTAFKLLATCDSLTRLHIEISFETMRCSRRSGLLNAHGVGHLLKIRGLKTVDFSHGIFHPAARTEGFEEIVRDALLQPRAPKKVSKGKKFAAGKKHTIESEEAPKKKKTKSVHDGSQIANE
jgi:hypothetical protein